MAEYFDDLRLSCDVQNLQDAIRNWATGHDIWFDCGFTTYQEHVDAEPGDVPVVFIQFFSSCFADTALYGNLEGEFWDLVSAHKFHFENANGDNLHFFPDEGERCDAYSNYLNWKWICSLVQTDFSDIYEELYAHFAKRPDDLQKLDWREFEILLARVFQAQGFTTELGPGRGDGGVDIRIFHRDPIGDVLTLVQAKKYSPRNKIGLEAVAALYGVADMEKATRSMVVTTSSYQPAAKNFAARSSGKIQLCTSNDVVQWCQTATQGIIRDKSLLVSPSKVERLLSEVSKGFDARVVYANAGTGIVANKFALVLKETKHAVLLMELPRKVVSDDGYGQRGTEIPLFDETALQLLRNDSVWRAKRSRSESEVARYWDGANGYSVWNREPVYFDYCD